ncbi:MAG: amidase [Clostridiales bacterium]|nr:amidase [Clostridiales bacterium]
MKKIILVLIILIICIGVGGFIFLKSLVPKQEEYIAYEKEKQITQVDAQLKGIDAEKVRAKKDIIMEKSIEEIQGSIAKGELTYEELTAFYLDRIKTYDAGERGINAVATINPNAIKEAKLHDTKPVKKGSMWGIPILIKDNINTKNMTTSGGTYALKDFVPENNAEMVDELIGSGAVILGKSNLSELANHMDNKMPSGYSSKAGQTHNPFNPIKLSPLGSSSGSGAAVAANFSAVAIGTETTGSIIAPSAIHSIVGFKPTKDAVSTEGVIPLSSTMDTVGPMAKNVKDIVALYNAAIWDKSKSISQELDAEYLRGKKVGIRGDDEGGFLAKKLKACGAEVVKVELSEEGIDNDYIITQDFKTGLNNYLKTYNAPVKSLSELIDFNKNDLSRRAKYGQTLIEEANQVKDFNKAKVNKMVEEARKRIDSVLRDNGLEVIVFLDNKGVLLSSVAGYPELTVPTGALEGGAPTGATFIASQNEDSKLANAAYSFEQNNMARLIPEKYIKYERENK